MTLLLSPNFSLEEMIHSDTAEAEGIVNAPNWDVIVQMVLLANNTLEKIRSIFGNKPLIISSGFRCGALNEAVGGAENSAHLLGCAADFTIEGLSPLEICGALEDRLYELEIDQLINEYDQWVHVGRVPFGQIPRGEVFAVS